MITNESCEKEKKKNLKKSEHLEIIMVYDLLVKGNRNLQVTVQTYLSRGLQLAEKTCVAIGLPNTKKKSDSYSLFIDAVPFG